MQQQYYSQAADQVNDCSDYNSFFVKVYMEGIPIGRKLNLLAHNSYQELVNTLEQMFDTTILCNSYSLICLICVTFLFPR